MRPCDATFRGARAPASRSAFSLLELLATLAVLGVMAASAIPAARSVAAFHVEAARMEVRTHLEFARETAAATGLPTGVSIDTGSQLMNYVQVPQPGEPPVVMDDASGEPRSDVRISRHGGTRVQDVAGTGLSGSRQVVWFGHAGIPEQRSASGAYQQEAPGDIVISFTSGDSITISAHTGMIR